MATYLGPSKELEGKKVDWSAEQIRAMQKQGHRFDLGQPDDPKPTPAQVNEAVIDGTTEADLDKAVKATVKETAAGKK